MYFLTEQKAAKRPARLEEQPPPSKALKKIAEWKKVSSVYF